MTSLQRRLLPSISALSALDAIARTGSFSAAAKELSLTQGAISRQIATLEEQFGQKLLERSHFGAVLTPAGVAYSGAAAQALESLRTAALQLMMNEHSHVLNLAVLPTFGTRWLLPRIPAFVAAYPQIILNFVTRIGQFDFAREGIDAAIHVGQPDWPGAECTFLMDEAVAPVCSPAFLAQNPLRQPADLLNLPLIHMASRTGAWTHWFASLGIAASGASSMRFEQFLSVAEACRAGLGVALMPLFLIRAELESGQLVLAWNHQVQSPSSYYLVVPQGKLQHLPVVEFRAWIGHEMARYRQQG